MSAAPTAAASATIAVANDNNHPRNRHDFNDRTRHIPSNAAAAATTTTTAAASAAAALSRSPTSLKVTGNNQIVQ